MLQKNDHTLFQNVVNFVGRPVKRLNLMTLAPEGTLTFVVIRLSFEPCTLHHFLQGDNCNTDSCLLLLPLRVP